MTDISEQLAIIRSNQYGESVKGAVRDALSLVAQDRGGEEIQRYAMGPATDDASESVVYDLLDYGLVQAHFSDSSGSVTPSNVNNLGTTDYIPITSSDFNIEAKIYVSTQTAALEWFFYCYNASKSFLSSKSSTAISTSGSSYKPWSWKAGTIISNIPTDIAYIRCGFRRSSSLPSLTLDDVTSATVTIKRYKYW